MDSYLARLNDDVQCSLCNDRLTEPKILKCFHTFCKPCIKRHAELIEEVNVFKCSQCKSLTPLSELNTVEDLKSSVLHSRMLKVLEFIESEKVCSVSQSHSTASWYCFDCNRSLCDDCEKSHSLFIKDHNLSSLAETKEEDIKLMLSRENNCEHHVDKLVQWFCKDCEKVICVECLKYGHEGHLTCTLSNYAATKRTFLSEKLEQLRKREQDMKAKFMAVEMMAVQFKESCEKAKLEVKGSLEKIVEILQKKALELTNQIDDEFMNAEKMKAEGQCLLDQQQGIISYLSKLLEKGIASEVIDDKEFEEKLDKPDIFQAEEKDYYGLTFVANQDLLREANLGLGTLQNIEDKQHTIGTAIACSTVQGEQDSVAVDRKTEITMKNTNFGSAASCLGTIFGSASTTAIAFGSTQTTAIAFGSPATAFGSTPTQATAFGSKPATTATTYGSAPATATTFGSTAITATTYGSAPATATTYGSAPATATTFGSTAITATTYGSAPATATTYGSAPATATTYGSAPAPGTTFGSTAITATTYGSAPATATTYGSAPSRGTTFGSTAITATTYGSAPATATTYGSAPATETAFGSTSATATSVSAVSSGFSFASPTVGTSIPSQPCEFGGDTGKGSIQTKRIIKKGLRNMKRF